MIHTEVLRFWCFRSEIKAILYLSPQVLQKGLLCRLPCSVLGQPKDQAIGYYEHYLVRVQRRVQLDSKSISLGFCLCFVGFVFVVFHKILGLSVIWPVTHAFRFLRISARWFLNSNASAMQIYLLTEFAFAFLKNQSSWYVTGVRMCPTKIVSNNNKFKKKKKMEVLPRHQQQQQQ